MDFYLGLAMAVAMNFFSYFFSDKMALGMYAAQSVTPEENGTVYARMQPMVAGLTQRMGIPMPKLWLIPDNSPNAFATGRNPEHASVAFTAGILNAMSDDEIEGVVAHELGHVLHRDILIASVAATIASAITFLARMGFFFGVGDRDDRRGGGLGGISDARSGSRGRDGDSDVDFTVAESSRPMRRRPDIRAIRRSSCRRSASWKCIPNRCRSMPLLRQLTCLSSSPSADRA